nr:uncharacterized protein LOC115265206 [Aedes albopictus]
MDVTTDSGGDLYWLLRIPGDGDCLFGSIANQLYGVNPNDESFKPHSLYLRDVAVTEIQLHPDVYYEDLEAMACELIEGSAAPVQKVLAYIERLRSPGYWGGAECISALANFLNVHCSRFAMVKCRDPKRQDQDVQSPPNYNVH